MAIPYEKLENLEKLGNVEKYLNRKDCLVSLENEQEVYGLLTGGFGETPTGASSASWPFAWGVWPKLGRRPGGWEFGQLLTTYLGGLGPYSHPGGPRGAAGCVVEPSRALCNSTEAAHTGAPQKRRGLLASVSPHEQPSEQRTWHRKNCAHQHVRAPRAGRDRMVTNSAEPPGGHQTRVLKHFRSLRWKSQNEPADTQKGEKTEGWRPEMQ